MRAQARVRVPATTANLGPGFDVLGLALSVHNEVEIVLDDPAGDLIDVVEGDAGAFPLDETNFVARGVHAAFRAAGRKTPPYSLRLWNRVPVARGLGSSAAALVGGAVAANAVLGDAGVDSGSLLNALLEYEGHAEQLAAALDGGLMAAAPPGGPVLSGLGAPSSPVTFGLPLAETLVFAIAVPDVELETKAARSVLPPDVAFHEAVANLGNLTALCAGLADGDPFLLRVGMRDALHQDRRAALCAPIDEVMAAARSAGAFGACWSGAGPSVLAVCDDDEVAAEIAEVMAQTFRKAKLDAAALVATADLDGARIVEVDREPYDDADDDEAAYFAIEDELDDES